MLTENQIKSLKPGDSLVMRGTYVKRYSNGDIVIKCDITSGGKLTPDIKHFHPICCSLPSDDIKYDPDRKFKKGDKVQPRSGKTVLASEYGYVTFHELAGEYEVYEDEARGAVTLIVNGHACFVSAFALELVTPVEELEPYSIEEETACAGDETYGIIHIYYNHNCGRDKVRTFYENGPESWNATKAAAEAERDRLNAEYRKKIS